MSWQAMRAPLISAVAVAATLGVGASLTGWFSPPEFTRALPSEPAAASAEFERRARSRFPIGSDSAQVVDALQRERFVRVFDPADGDLVHFRREEGGMGCRRHADVWWSTGHSGSVTSMRGSYTVAECD